MVKWMRLWTWGPSVITASTSTLEILPWLICDIHYSSRCIFLIWENQRSHFLWVMLITGYERNENTSGLKGCRHELQIPTLHHLLHSRTSHWPVEIIPSLYETGAYKLEFGDEAFIHRRMQLRLRVLGCSSSVYDNRDNILQKNEKLKFGKLKL